MFLWHLSLQEQGLNAVRCNLCASLAANDHYAQQESWDPSMSCNAARWRGSLSESVTVIMADGGGLSGPQLGLIHRERKESPVSSGKLKRCTYLPNSKQQRQITCISWRGIAAFEVRACLQLLCFMIHQLVSKCERMPLEAADWLKQTQQCCCNLPKQIGCAVLLVCTHLPTVFSAFLTENQKRQQ